MTKEEALKEIEKLLNDAEENVEEACKIADEAGVNFTYRNVIGHGQYLAHRPGLEDRWQELKKKVESNSLASLEEEAEYFDIQFLMDEYSYHDGYTDISLDGGVWWVPSRYC